MSAGQLHRLSSIDGVDEVNVEPPRPINWSRNGQVVPDSIKLDASVPGGIVQSGLLSLSEHSKSEWVSEHIASLRMTHESKMCDNCGAIVLSLD